MNLQPIVEGAMVDVVFPIDGKFLPRDHTQQLCDALCRQWPQLGQEAQVGIHAIKLVSGGSEPAMLSRRAKLLLRVPRDLAARLLACPGIGLQIDGQTLQLNAPHARDLQPHTTLYAYHVAATSADESAFMADVSRELTALGVLGERVCGKRQQMKLGSGVVNTFSLMLHALAPEQSLRLQHHGIGPHRLFGCGLFIPHKSAAAV
jgi:CRISPR-associated protein Cas6